jgi:hypothetical protein
MCGYARLSGYGALDWEWIGLGESAWRYVGELGSEMASNRSGWCVGFIPLELDKYPPEMCLLLNFLHFSLKVSNDRASIRREERSLYVDFG